MITPGSQEGHGIADAVFTVEFDRAPTSGDIQAALELHDKYKDSYPRSSKIEGPLFSINAQSGTVVAGNAELGGFRFDYVKPDGGVARAITFQNNLLSIGRPDYTRWKHIWPEVENQFLQLLEVFLSHLSITKVHLQMLNRFSSEDHNEIAPSNVLRADSRYIAPAIFEISSAWHSDIGFYEDSKLENTSRTLVAAKAKHVRQSTGLQHVDITTKFALEFQSPLNEVGSLYRKTEGSTYFERLMQHMREMNKDVLESILNDDLCELINLRIEDDD